MYDDLDPGFVPSSDAALSHVAARVRRLRLRQQVTRLFLGGGALVVVIALASVAFGSNGGNPHQVTVAASSTTTTAAHQGFVPPPPTGTSTSSSTTAAVTVPVTTAPATTTAPRPARITVTLDRQQLTIQSGTRVTVAYTVKNDGDLPGEFLAAACPYNELWPDGQSSDQPELWPVPVNRVVFCGAAVRRIIGAHQSKTFGEQLIGGLSDGSGHVVPAPPGHTSIDVGGVKLPVTITPPDTVPLTVVHPSEVTTASNAEHFVDFTVTNHLPFPVRYTDQGPCSSDTGPVCVPTTGDKSVPRDLRFPPYATAENPLYLTSFVLGAHETKTARAKVDGTRNLWDVGNGNPPMAPGTYHFDWDGEKVKLTVTAPTQ